MWNDERSTITQGDWWWNRDVDEAVTKRKICYKGWLKSKWTEDKHALDASKKEVDPAVMPAQ